MKIINLLVDFSMKPEFLLVSILIFLTGFFFRKNLNFRSFYLPIILMLAEMNFVIGFFVMENIFMTFVRALTLCSIIYILAKSYLLLSLIAKDLVKIVLFLQVILILLFYLLFWKFYTLLNLNIILLLFLTFIYFMSMVLSREAILKS